MGKFDKNSTCEYCEKEMISKNRNKRFCSDKCRVYFKRENVQLIEKKTGQNLSQKTTIIATKDLSKSEIFKMIREGKM